MAVLLVGALLSPVAGAKARFPRLDSSFGSGGYVALPGELPGPSNERMNLESLGAAPGGAVYASETSLIDGQCGAEKCLYRGFLARVNSDGSIAATFGGSGRVEVTNSAQRLSPAISDPEGQALVASVDGVNVTVYRYLADGSADGSFGSSGAVSFDCGCGASQYREIRLAVDGQGRIVVLIDNPSNFSTVPASATLARLLPGGAMDSGFGSGGVLQLGAQPTPRGIAFGSNNAILIWGSPCCQASTPFLHRVSAKGLVDSAWAALPKGSA